MRLYKHKVRTSGKVTTLYKKCAVSGVEYTLDLLTTDYLAWKKGGLVQRVFPQLNADQREFIMTGVTPLEWNAMFPEPEGRGDE